MTNIDIPRTFGLSLMLCSALFSVWVIGLVWG